MPSLLPTLISSDTDAPLARAIAERIPDHMREGLLDYFRYGIPPGAFLRAVLTNDLTKACRCADPINRLCLQDYIVVLVNHAPEDSWGSREAVQAWIERGLALRLEASA